MSFVDGFYSFSIDITHPDSGVYEKCRVKYAKHPNQSFSDLFARIIAFAHAYQPGLEFSEGLFDPTQASIWAKDAINQITLWVEVGSLDRKKLERSLKHARQAEHRVYFTEAAQIQRFCHVLRGSKTNWVSDVKFFLIDPMLSSDLAEQIQTSGTLQAFFTDERAYLNYNSQQFEGSLATIDIWAAYQDSLAQAADVDLS